MYIHIYKYKYIYIYIYIYLVGGQLAGALLQVDVALLACDVGDAATDTADRRQREHHLLPAIHVRVAHAQDVLEVLRLELDRHGAERAGQPGLGSGGGGEHTW